MLVDVSWPSDYRREFVTTRGTALIYSIVLVSKYLAGTPARIAKTAGVVALALAAGMLLSALDRFAIGWQAYLLVCTALPLAGLIFGISITHRRSLDLYRSGTPSKLVIAHETLFLELNSHYFKSELRQLTGIRHVLGFALLVYEDQTVLLVPWWVLPKTARS